MRHPFVLVGLTALAGLGGCDYSGDFLFAGQVIDDIWILTGPDGGDIVPVDIITAADIGPATLYAEVGAPLTTAYGGVTFEFLGTGDDVCLWVDPEVAYWTQSIAVRPSAGAAKWVYPDNVFDDGDIDLFAGLSVYYTGSPGIEIGDFEVQYEDSLGNKIPISLANCPSDVSFNEVPVSAGRGSPDYCTITDTDAGIGYTVLLRTWSTPLDDDRLSFGLIVANGTCEALRKVAVGAGPTDPAPLRSTDECLVKGEALIPEGEGVVPLYGKAAAEESGRIWPASEAFETAFCAPDAAEGLAPLRQFCRDEANAMDDAGVRCSWNLLPTAEDRCYCGNPEDTPDPGAL